MIFTFFSYKGGVGRSMALANIAELYYRKGLSVLMIDWDLEAPGLENYFLEREAASASHSHPGLAEMLQDYKIFMSNPDNGTKNETFSPLPEGISPYCFEIQPKNDRGAKISLLPAGRRDDQYVGDYTEFVRTFDWLDFYKTWNGNSFFEWFRVQVEQLADVVLIDSRTGLSEMGGVCTYQLADAVVMFCAPYRQSVEGTLEMANRLLADEFQQARERAKRPLSVVVIPSRVEDRVEGGSLGKFKENFLARFGTPEPWVKFIPEIDPSDSWGEFLWNLKIPHVPYYAFDEKIAVQDSLTIGDDLRKAYQQIGLLLQWMAPKDSKLSRRKEQSIDFRLAAGGAAIWLKKMRLVDNPFLYQDAEQDALLPAYFTRFPNLHAVTTSDMTLERKSWFFFGNSGSGKTALRKFIAARGRQQKPDADMVCIEYDQVKIEHLLNNTNDIDEFQVSFVHSIFEELSTYTGSAIQSSQPPGSLRGNLANLSVALREVGIHWVLCLIDPGKPAFEWKNSQVRTSALITSLFSLSEVGGYGFRYFLPSSMKAELKSAFSRLPYNYIRTLEIKWDERTLRDMLGKRMTLLSIDQTAPYRSLGELCEDEQNLSTLIDAEIAGLSQDNPRAAIWLANRLIEQHCERYPLTPRIDLETWNNVKRAWWSDGASRILGTEMPPTLRVLSDRIYYQSWEIILPALSHRLLKALILAGGNFCSKEDLIRSGWKGAKNLAGISDKALSEAVRHMKEELRQELKAKGLPDFNGIKSVRGRGYRLLQPGTGQIVQDGDHDR